MKKVFLTVGLALAMMIGATSCKKKDVTPSTTKSETVVETRYVTEDGVPADTYYVLQFGIDETANWSQMFWVNECGEVGINTNFYSNDVRRVEIYKTNDGTSNFVWMGEVSVNAADSSFIITEIGGQNVDLVAIECDGMTKLQIQE